MNRTLRAPFLSAGAALCFLLAGCGDLLGHISANVPDEAVFHQLLERDLNLYFTNTLKTPVTVSYKLLRDGPTQSGAAYPKYYVWVKIYSGEKLKDAGAVRVAAVDKTSFQITDFCSRDEIKSHPEVIQSVFPRPLCEDILARARVN